MHICVCESWTLCVLMGRISMPLLLLIPGTGGQGFGRHLERQDQIKRMREEQQEREEKVFLTNAKGSRHVITRPQPFKLHQNFHAEERTKKMIEELRNREQEVWESVLSLGVGFSTCDFVVFWWILFF